MQFKNAHDGQQKCIVSVCTGPGLQLSSVQFGSHDVKDAWRQSTQTQLLTLTDLVESTQLRDAFIGHVQLLTLTDLVASTQLHDAFIGHVRRRHHYTSYWLAAAKLGRLVPA